MANFTEASTEFALLKISWQLKLKGKGNKKKIRYTPTSRRKDTSTSIFRKQI